MAFADENLSRTFNLDEWQELMDLLPKGFSEMEAKIDKACEITTNDDAILIECDRYECAKIDQLAAQLGYEPAEADAPAPDD